MSIAAFDARLKRFEIGERLVRRNPLYYFAVQRELIKLDVADIGELESWTQRRLQKVLSAARHSAYGQSIGAPRALQDWPLLDKERVRNNPQSFCQGRSWAHRLLHARASTGGTTGLPLKLFRSPESVVAEQVCQDAAITGLGIDPRHAKVAVLRADPIKDPSDMKPPFWTYTLAGRRLVLSSNHLSEQTLAYYIEELRKFAPELLWVYPTALESLCLLLLRAGERVAIPRVLSSSEVLGPAVWDQARAALGCAIVDRYGQAERVACAHAFAPGAYRFVPGYSHVELILDSEEEATALYEIVGTSLWNMAMPLVRYRTGDLVRLPRSYGAREIEEVALGARTFEGVLGRMNDVLLAPDGTRVLIGINHIPRDVEHLMRLQIVQETPDRVVLRVLAAPGFSDADAQQLLRNARQKIPEPVDVQVEVTDELQRTARGKTPYVIHGSLVQQAFRNIGVTTAAA